MAHLAEGMLSRWGCCIYRISVIYEKISLYSEVAYMFLNRALQTQLSISGTQWTDRQVKIQTK